MDVRIAAPRRHLPAWAWVLGAVLLANLGVLAWLLLRAPVPAPAAITAQPPPAVPAPAPASAAAIAPVITPAAPPVTPVATAPVPVPALFPDVETETLPAAQAQAPAQDTALDVDNLPTMQDLIATGVTLPAMQLNLHVYDEAPAGRYVLLNSRRLREGDELQDGIRLVRITPRGVVLNARGRLFLLAAGG
jgi:general secretion pathway protein B